MLIFVDIDTQRDFINPDGALYVPNATSIKPQLKHLAEVAAIKKIKIYKTFDTHTAESAELESNGGPFPEHCMANTKGWQSIKETKHSDVVFRKDSYDIFTNPKFKKQLKEDNVIYAIVYGIATDYCVKAAIVGIRKLDIETLVVYDAIKGVEENTTKDAIIEMLDAGASFVFVNNIKQLVNPL